MKKYIPLIIFIAILAIGVVGIVLNAKAQGETNKYKNSKNLIELSASEFKTKIENKDSFILLIKKDGCPYCEEFDPIIKEVLETNEITAYALNTSKLTQEEYTYLKNIANVSNTPTTLFIVNGEEETTLNRIIGKVTKSKLANRLKELGYIK